MFLFIDIINDSQILNMGNFHGFTIRMAYFLSNIQKRNYPTMNVSETKKMQLY